MRVTNKMMNNNSLRNINNNKAYLDKLNNQMASEKKITRPSDDPVIAIRALKLRSNLTEITQYYDKNTNDASAWMTASQDAVESTKEILIDMKSKITTAATGTNTVESRDAILSELKALKEQIYDDGNADYAGRKLFTGYRTSTRLTLEEQDLPTKYTGITETLDRNDVDKVTRVSGKINPATDIVDASATAVGEYRINSNDVSRLRLAYSKVDKNSVSDITITDSEGNYKSRITVKSYDATSFASYDEYLDKCCSPGDDEAVFIPETGEIILGKNKADQISALTDSDVLTVSYDKSSWVTGDIRPEHYFNCTQQVMDSQSNILDIIQYDSHDQQINYDISSNQQIQINTNASEIFVHAIGRDIEDIIRVMEEADAADNNVARLESMLEDNNYSETEKASISTTLDAAKKERDMVMDKLQKTYEHGLDTFTGHIENATVTGTKIGSRIERLGLVKNRLMDLKTTARELADDNENVELTDIAINVKEAELTYNAALMATGQISQQSLLNYI